MDICTDGAKAPVGNIAGVYHESRQWHQIVPVFIEFITTVSL